MFCFSISSISSFILSVLDEGSINKLTVLHIRCSGLFKDHALHVLRRIIWGQPILMGMDGGADVSMRLPAREGYTRPENQALALVFRYPPRTPTIILILSRQLIFHIRAILISRPRSLNFFVRGCGRAGFINIFPSVDPHVATRHRSKKKSLGNWET